MYMRVDVDNGSQNHLWKHCSPNGFTFAAYQEYMFIADSKGNIDVDRPWN